MLESSDERIIVGNVVNSLLQELKATAKLAAPLVATGLAQMGMEIVDVVMMGRLGPGALAAGALGWAIFMALLVVCMGMVTSIGVLTARAYGVKDFQLVSRVTRQGLWLVLMISIPCLLILWGAAPFLLFIGENPLIVLEAKGFIVALSWGIIPAVGFFALRELVSALAMPRIVMVISIFAIPLNALANYILMYGKLGFPELGLVGIGYASSLVEWVSFLFLVLYVWLKPQLKPYRIFTQIDMPRRSLLKEIFKLGWPMGALFGFEVGLFSITTLMMGFFGAISLAAHQIAFQAMSVAFMLPLGISQATAVRVGHAAGAGQMKQAKKAAYSGIILGFAFATLAALVFWIFPQPITHLFINLEVEKNQPVLAFATVFLGIAAVFTIMDALQVIMTGILRGFKDTFMPMLLGLMSYWIIGLGSGYLLAFVFQWQGAGLWWGLAIGITASGLLLLLRFETNSRLGKYQ